MKKNSIPNEEAIRKGIIGKSMGGVHFKTFISAVRGKFYKGYEVQEEMQPVGSGESWKPGNLLEVKEARDFKEAFRDVMGYGL